MTAGVRWGARVSVALLVLGGAVSGQRGANPPQPRADKLPAVSPARPNRGVLVDPPAGARLSVPDGFNVSLYAELPAPRLMVYAPNGDLFVSSPAANTITVLRDGNNDGTFEARSVYAAGTPPSGRPGGAAPVPSRGTAAPRRADAPDKVNPTINGAILGTKAPACMPPPPANNRGQGTLAAPFGMAFHDGYLYVANTASLVRFKYTSGDLKAPGEPERLLDLPPGGHSTRNITFNRSGTKLYVAVGSNSNNNAGEDCRRGAILEFDPDGSGYRLFASGLRNPVGLAWQPATDILWATVNERDNLGDDLVPDYATAVKDGGFYGWPYSYIGNNYDPRYAGAFPDLVKRAIVPDVLIPAHSAALGITFYTGTQFPQRYRNGAFVALHGSWNRSVSSGYKVIFFPMTNGRPGPIEDFITGFVVTDGEAGTLIERWGRPMAVAVTPDGSLLVSDDSAGKIWKVSARR